MTEFDAPDQTPAPRPTDAERAAFVATFGTQALSLTDLDALLHDAAVAAARGMAMARAKVLEYRSGADDLLIRAGVNWHPGVVGRATLSASLRSPPGHTFRTGQALPISDLRAQQDYEHSPLLREHGVISLLNVPVRTDRGIWGVLEVDGLSPSPFPEDGVHFLQGLANVLGAAIQRVQTETALRERTLRLQVLSDAAADLLAEENPDAVLRRFFDAAQELGLDAAFSYVTGESEHTLTLNACFGVSAAFRQEISQLDFGQLVSGSVAQTGQSRYLPRLQASDDPRLLALKAMGFRAYVCNPLLAEGNLLGTLSFASRSRDRFTADDLAFFRTISHYVAVVRERLRAQRALTRANTELEHRVEERTRQLVESNRRLRHEISEREHAEAELSRREADFRALYNKAPAPQHSLDAEGRLIGVSDYWLELMGYGREPVLGRPITDFMTPNSVKRHTGRWSEFLATGEERGLELQLVKQSGEIMDALIARRAERDADGKLVRTLSVLTDITAWRKVERERDRLFEISQDLIVIASLDGTFRDLNPAAERAIGRRLEEVLGTSYLDYVHPEDHGRILAAVAQLRDGSEAVRVEVRYRGPDGTWRWTSWRATAVLEEGVLYAFGRDVTQRRQTEEALRQAQKMEAVGHLTGGVAHDFNNLLTVIMGNLELLRPRIAEQARLRRMVDAMQHAIERGERLTSQLLAFSRRQNLQPEVLDPNRLVRNFEPLIRRAVGETVRLETRLAPDVWPCNIDATQLEAALLNLAVNARDAMPEGGDVVIETLNVEADTRLTARVLGAAPGPYVVVAVCDTGSGMPPEVIQRAFEPFFTTKEVGRGTGLGLSQVYGFVEQSGGHVTIDSEQGRGTIIRLYLPPAETAPDRGGLGRGRKGEALARGSERILLVEDNPDVLRTASAMLLDLGYEVYSASDPAKALELLRDEARRFDLLFSDIVMPRMSGPQLAVEARKLRPALKVLLTSGYSRENLASQPSVDQAVPVISKPYKQAELAAMLRSVIEAE